MADLATDRQKVQDTSKRRSSDGALLVVEIPWQLVTYPGGIAGLEPVDMAPVGKNIGSSTTDKEVTGIQGIREDVLFSTAGTAGNVGWPV